MPTYAYECGWCGRRFERLVPVRMRDRGARCPDCLCDRARRLPPTGIGLVFKGSGFYATDYAGKGNGCTRKR